MSRWAWMGLALWLGLGLAWRAPDLSLRPMHNDEGVNAMKFRALYVDHDYKYNPNEFHGPTLPYFTLPAVWLQGGGDFNRFGESTYRAVTVAFGLGLILLLTLLAANFGRAETLWAAAFTALSPAMVFYSRYYIHEMLLVFFSAWTFICAWRYVNSGRALWAVAAGAGLGLMYATKETFVLAVAAMVLAVATSSVWHRWRGNNSPVFQPQWKWPHLAVALAAAAMTAIVFFSSFFTHAAGLVDAIKTYLPWLRRAGGGSATVHAHPWFFYFQRLLWFHVHGGPFWSEGFVAALALVGFFGAWRGQSLLPRLIAFYTFWLTVIYTALPYKTPWCLLGFYHGMILLAGVGAALLWRGCHAVFSKAAFTVILTAGLVHLGWQSWLGNFGTDSRGALYCASVKNPYVYSQTLPDAVRLAGAVEAIAAVSPQGDNTEVDVMSPESYWPLPWYFRRLKKVGYWDKIPARHSAPIMIVSTDLRADFDERPGHTHLMAGYFALRPQVFLELYVNTNLWAAYIKTLPPEKD